MKSLLSLLVVALTLSTGAALSYADDGAPLESRTQNAGQATADVEDASAFSGFEMGGNSSAAQEDNINRDIEAGGIYYDDQGAAGRLGSESAGGLRGGVDLSIQRK